MITSMNHITLAVQNIQRSFYFYHDVLGLKPLCRWNNGAYFLVDGFWFCLNVDTKRVASECYTHYAFSVSQKDFTAMSERVISSGATVFKDNTSPGDSLYFLDPDGHKLEIHTGNWQTRIAAKQQDVDNWQDVEWFLN